MLRFVFICFFIVFEVVFDLISARTPQTECRLFCTATREAQAEIARKQVPQVTSFVTPSTARDALFESLRLKEVLAEAEAPITPTLAIADLQEYVYQFFF